MIFSGHSRSLHLLRSSSDESLATSTDPEGEGRSRHHISPHADTTLCTDKTAPWFVAKASEKEAPKTEPSTQVDWPNGLPPSGPRSHRIAISPPATRRSSSEREHVRRISDNGTATSFSRQSFPSSVQWRRSDAIPATSMPVDVLITARNTGKPTAEPGVVVPSDLEANAYQTSEHDRQAASRLGTQTTGREMLGKVHVTATERVSAKCSADFLPHPDAVETPYSERFLDINSSAYLSPAQPKLQNGHCEETASVVSDLTMSSGAAASGRSSMTSSSRTRKCHKCKKAAQAASPLYKCSQCPRRYHRHCAVPRIPSSSQATGAPEWVCKHCVNGFREKETPGSVDLQYSPQSLEDRIGLRSDYPPTVQCGANGTMAACSEHPKGSCDSRTAAVEERITLAEGDADSHTKEPAEFGFRLAVSNATNQNVTSHVEQPEKPKNPAYEGVGWISEARATKQEPIGGIFSAISAIHFDPPPAQVCKEYSGSGVDGSGKPIIPPRKALRTHLSGSLGEVATIDKRSSSKPVATNGFIQNHSPNLEDDCSFDPCAEKEYRAPHIYLDGEGFKESATSISSENSRGQGWPTSDTTATTGRLQTFPETMLSTIGSQPGKPSLKRLTCYHWKQRGGCRYREEDCQYSHHDTGLDEGKNTTCFWWWTTGHCKKSEKECLYAHRDTGNYAKPPPGYVPQNRIYTAPRSPDRYSRISRADHYSPPLSPERTHGPANGLAAELPPSLPGHVALPSGILGPSWDGFAIPDMDGPPVDKAEEKVTRADPRLLRRPSSMSVQDTVEKAETFLAAAEPDVSIASAIAKIEPVTPVTKPANGMEPASSFKKCGTCDKKVFGSASLCFTCKGTGPATSKAVMKSSPFVPETPKLDTDMTPEVADQPTPELMPPADLEKKDPLPLNNLKRTISAVGPGTDNNMFIRKKARVFKPSELRQAGLEMSPPQVKSPPGRDKPDVPPQSNASIHGITTKTAVHLEELIELERLRKQVAHFEKSKAEEKEAQDEARRLYAEEKERADKLAEEIQFLKFGGRDSTNLEGQKKVVAEVTQSRKQQRDDMQDHVPSTPQIARRSKTRPTHVRQQSSNEYDRTSETSLQSPLRLREIRIGNDKKKLVRNREARGPVFESDDESDDGPEVPPPKSFKPPSCSLWRAPKSSRNLFEVAPQYQQENVYFDPEAKKKEIAARPSRKKTFGRVLALIGRQQGIGNVHWEVDRSLPVRMVRVSVPDISDELDPFQEAPPMKEVEMSFEEFLGVPENALLCTTTAGQLAYRDSILDQYGKLRRVPDDEKFEIGTKGG